MKKFFNYLVNESIHFFGFFFGHTFTEETVLERKLKEMKNENVVVGETNVQKEVVYTYANEDVNQEVNVEKGSDNNELY